MTSKEFIQKVWDLYDVANHAAEAYSGSKAGKIRRGRSHCIASQVEDLFAQLIFESLQGCHKDFVVFVDQPVSVGKIGKRVKTVYPDIMVGVRNAGATTITHIYELKTNTGWMRDGADKCLAKMRQTREWLVNEATIRDELSSASVPTTLTVAQNVKYDLVVLSSVNNKSGKAKKLLWDVTQDGGDVFRGWLLSNSELSPKHALGTREDREATTDFDAMVQDLVAEME